MKYQHKTENVSIPYYYEMPAGYCTIRVSPLQGEAHAVEQVAYAQVFREETGRVVGLLRRPGNRLHVIVKA